MNNKTLCQACVLIHVPHMLGLCDNSGSFIISSRNLRYSIRNDKMTCICEMRALLSHVAVTRWPEHVSVRQRDVINTVVETAFAL